MILFIYLLFLIFFASLVIALCRLCFRTGIMSSELLDGSVRSLPWAIHHRASKHQEASKSLVKKRAAMGLGRGTDLALATTRNLPVAFSRAAGTGTYKSSPLATGVKYASDLRPPLLMFFRLPEPPQQDRSPALKRSRSG